MTQRDNAALLGDLPLEALGLRALGAQRGVFRTHDRARSCQSPGPVVGQDREEARVIRTLGHSEEGHEPPSAAQCVAHTCREIV
jgi:hypothetical protein